MGKKGRKKSQNTEFKLSGEKKINYIVHSQCFFSICFIRRMGNNFQFLGKSEMILLTCTL